MKKLANNFFVLVIPILILLKEISIYAKRINNPDFSFFIRDYFNKVYIDNSGREDLLIERVILLMGFYFVVYYFFYKEVAINIESFKNIIKYNSSSVLVYYFKTIRFFSFNFFKSVIFNFIVFVSICRLFSINNNYLWGFIDLIKLSMLLYLCLFVGVLFPIRRVMLSVLIYMSILLYILFFNKLSIFIIFIFYLLFFIFVSICFIFKKFDV